MDGYLLPDRFEPKYEYFVRKAKPSAIKLLQALDSSGDPNLDYYEKEEMQLRWWLSIPKKSLLMFFGVAVTTKM